MERKGKAKMSRGVTIRKHANVQTLIITFTFKGVCCREPLRGLPVTPSNIKYAERQRGEILNSIERGTFNYADFFPKSSKLKIFGYSSKGLKVKSYLDSYLSLCEKRKLSPSTINGYQKCINALHDLHDICITELTPGIIKNWVQEQTTSIKTKRNNLSYLKSSLDDAIIDGIISINPVQSVSVSKYHDKSTEQDKSDYVVDPFSPDEVNAILQCCSNEQWENLFRFAFATGMRSSELCALKWKNIDFIKNKVHVNSARVVGVEKGTKTKAGTRIIDLDNNALIALAKQKKFSFLHNEYVFLDPKTNKQWEGADAIRKKAWVPVLKRSGVRYRNPYQTRHTFATHHLSNGVNLFWLAEQMGHKGPEMLFRHYGSYLESYDGNTSIKKTSK